MAKFTFTAEVKGPNKKPQPQVKPKVKWGRGGSFPKPDPIDGKIIEIVAPWIWAFIIISVLGWWVSIW